MWLSANYPTTTDQPDSDAKGRRPTERASNGGRQFGEDTVKLGEAQDVVVFLKLVARDRAPGLLIGRCRGAVVRVRGVS